MRKVFGAVLIFLGAVLVCSGLAVTAGNLWQQEKAGASAQQAMDRLRQQMPDQPVQAPTAVPVWPEMEETSREELRSMPEVVIDGVAYVGYLTIPALNLELPVISQTTTENLELAPCRFSGTAYQKDFVIGGHRYRRHFRKLSTLGYGQIIRFTDMDGNEFTYEVAEQEVLQPSQAQYLCTGDWDLSLYTCPPGGLTRVVLRCLRVSG